MMDTRGKKLYYDKLLDHPATMGLIVFFLIGIFVFSTLIILLFVYWADSFIFYAIFIIGSMTVNITYFVFKIYTLQNKYNLAIYENGFILPSTFNGSRNNKGFIAFNNIQSAKFFSWGLGVKIRMKNEEQFDIGSTMGEKPFRMIADKIIVQLNLVDIPDYSYIDNWNNYKTKTDRKTAMIKHMEINKRFV